jgi:hypothetical protein
MTDPGVLAGLYDDLPDDPSTLRDIVSRLIIHVSWAARYGITPDVPLPRDTQSVFDRLKLTQTVLAGSITAQRPPEKRTFGTCRDYSLMLCSMLRHRSIPARVRCGFATYLNTGPHEDHWICEYWSTVGWVRTDAQLDGVHQDQLGIDFNCADLPNGTFLSGAEAWMRTRAAVAAPDDFGHGDAKGLWFLRVNLCRDLFALTNQHVSAWDTWRNSTAYTKVLSDADAAFGDRLARAIVGAECSTDGIGKLKRIAADIQTPPWQS